MCVLFSVQLLSETFLIVRTNEREVIKCVLVFMERTIYSCQTLVKLDFFDRFFLKKSSNIKFHENPSSGSRVVPYRRKDGQTDRCGEANSRFSQFCQRASKCVMMLLSYGTVSPHAVCPLVKPQAHISSLVRCP